MDIFPKTSFPASEKNLPIILYGYKIALQDCYDHTVDAAWLDMHGQERNPREASNASTLALLAQKQNMMGEGRGLSSLVPVFMNDE